MKSLYGFSAGILWDDGYWYFSNLDFNGLFKMNMDGEVKFLMFFPDEKKQQEYLHKKCLRYNDTILFIPESAEHLHIYKPENGKMDVVKCEHFVKKDVVFAEPVLRDRYLFIFPAAFGQPIIKICLDDYSCAMNWEFADWCKRKLHTEEDVIFTRVAQRDHSVWLAVRGSDQIVRVSLDCLDRVDAFSLYSLGNPDISLFAIFESKMGFWLAQKEAGTILHWDEKGNRLEEYFVEEEKIEEGRPFNHILETDFGVYAIPAYAKNIQKLTPENQRFHKAAAISDELKKRESKIAFFGIQHRGNELWLFPYGFYQMLVFDMSMDQLRIFKIKDEKLSWNSEPYLSVYLEGYKDTIMRESERMELEDFINLLGY